MIEPRPQSGGDSREDKALSRQIKHTLEREGQRERQAPGKKDTRRWCRGKVGVEHRPEWQTWLSCMGQGAWWKQVCVVCGKRLRFEFRKTDATNL